MDPTVLSGKYHGDIVKTYEATRRGSYGWRHQQAVTERFLATLPRDTTVLDVPVGTGRFLDTYERYGLRATGVDISPAMLTEARAKALHTDLRVGSIFDLPFADDSFDVVVCMRFLNWVTGEPLDRAMAELARVARTSIVCSIKHYLPASELGVSRRLLRQLKQRFYKTRHRDGHHCHKRDDVLALLHRHNLRVRTVDNGAGGKKWRTGVAAGVFLLDVTTAGPDEVASTPG